MTLPNPHRCYVTGPGPATIGCICATGRDHDEEHMDCPGGPYFDAPTTTEGPPA